MQVVKRTPWFPGGIVLVGMPMDTTVTYRPGARWGPTGIRSSIGALEHYSPYLKKTMVASMYKDAGDLRLPLGNTVRSLALIRDFFRNLSTEGSWPIALGGEHLVTLPIVEAMLETYPDLVVLQLDAHADLCDSYMGEALSHATVMRRVVERLGSGRRLYQFGIRSWTEEEEAYAQRERVHQYPLLDTNSMGVSMEACLADLADLPPHTPLYVTLDVDVLDPAYAPGTGTPEPGGLSTLQLLSFLHRLSYSAHRIVGVDLVEVAPDLDPTGQTGVLGAKLLREVVLGFPPERR
ncbi:agmatinase [Pasteuria penetrans]|uniref:agmatinase n=1 Tax=Pasteuria penetrans TaxID=86005 RepID=UPI000FB98191|nr:agmatinase [Pasteuria penetrans]